MLFCSPSLSRWCSRCAANIILMTTFFLDEGVGLFAFGKSLVDISPLSLSLRLPQLVLFSLPLLF